MPSTGPVQRLVDAFSRLPGIGPRAAERLAFHILKSPVEEAFSLADALRDVRQSLRHCSRCFNLANEDLCEICRDARRDEAVICVVEQPRELTAIEGCGIFHGTYHVLLGRLAPLEGLDVEDLTVDSLFQRLQEGKVTELILGTNPTTEGDTTALYLREIVAQRFPAVRVTRLARGLPNGAGIEFASRNILAEAMLGRQDL